MEGPGQLVSPAVNNLHKNTGMCFIRLRFIWQKRIILP